MQLRNLSLRRGDTTMRIDPATPRRDGLRGFLAARDISIPEGSSGDSRDAETIHALADRKNEYVLERIARDGVQVYGDAVALLRTARALGVRTAVVTASENAGSVLAAAGIVELFDARIGGLEIERLGADHVVSSLDDIEVVSEAARVELR
jgi:beta-phosphoglucomutase-like phosphatase (HAD superfamily)